MYRYSALGQVCMKSWFRLAIFAGDDRHAVVAAVKDDGAMEALEEGSDY